MLFLFRASLCMCILAACTSGEKESENYADIIVLSDSGGQFRGISIRDTQDEVRAKETLNLVKDSVGELKYAAPIGAEQEANLTVYYTFDQYGLFEIQADLVSEDTALISNVEADLRKRYSEKYGQPENTFSGYSWTTTSPVNSLVEVRLSTERNSKGHPYLSINFFEPLEDEI